MVLMSMKPEVLIPEVPLMEYIMKSLQTRKDKVAQIFAPTGREYTYGDIADQAMKCASALFKLGLRKGDVVAICASNSPEYFSIILAISACGATITTCNPLFTVGEIRSQFEHSQPKMVFCVPGNLKTIKRVMEFVQSVKRVYTIGKAESGESYESLLKNETGKCFPRVQIDVHEDVLLLLYSSGTTGVPKGVMLSHHNFISALSIVRAQHLWPSDSVYSCLPVFHSYGMLYGFSYLDQGVKIILDNRMNLKKMLAYVEKYKVTTIQGVPPILLAIEKSPALKQYDLSSLRRILCGAAPLAPQIAESLESKIGCKIMQVWGLTEAGLVSQNHPEVTPFESIGSVPVNTKLKVIDVTTGEELGPYQDGELCLKGPQVMKGYFKNREATMSTIDADGWLHTGDIGHYDDNEMIYIADRLKELIKYKGFQVAPAEIEAILITHPKILDAGVIGVPDPMAGEAAKAYIVKNDSSLTAKEIDSYIQGKLTKYKHLHGGIEFCSSIPKNASGKILRKELRLTAQKSKM